MNPITTALFYTGLLLVVLGIVWGSYFPMVEDKRVPLMPKILTVAGLLSLLAAIWTEALL